MNLEENQPQDVTSAKDAPPGTLLEEVFAFEKKQEAAVVAAAKVLSDEFGGTTECVSYKVQPDRSLVVIYQIKEKQEVKK